MNVKVIGVQDGFSGRLLEVPFNDEGGFKVGDNVVFKDEEENEEYGTIHFVDRETGDKDNVAFKAKVLRLVTPNDQQKIDRMEEGMEQDLVKCKELVQKFGLEMQVFRVGYSLDAKKIHFTFTAEDRVDFRELVRELARVFKKQIYLRQVGPRDRASLLGGYGRCGRVRCSTAFLRDLESINMDMVRVQGLEGRGSSKLSGNCGKLLCCLKFEIDTYKELRAALPRIGNKVAVRKGAGEKGGGEGEVIALDVLNQKLRVLLKDQVVETYDVKDVEKVFRDGAWKKFEHNDMTMVIDSESLKVAEPQVDDFMEGPLANLTQ